MINLIPNQDKKTMARDFYIRLVALCFIMLGICVLFASASILPAYFSTSSKKNLAAKELETQKQEVVPEVDQKSLALIKELNAKLILIETAEKNKFTISEKVLLEVLSEKMSDIKISQISYENNPIKGKLISLRGTAPSRERLLLFRKSLEDNSNFKSVDLPISNFLKGTNLEFYLVLTSS